MNDLVVKHNALTTASYSLSLTEQRLILLAIVAARRSGKVINANDPLTISASDYAQQFDTTRQASYSALKEATETLFNRYFRYQEMTGSHKKNVKSRWVSKVAYIDDLAQIELIFSPDVVPLITELERNFTHYAIEQISSLIITCITVQAEESMTVKGDEPLLVVLSSSKGFLLCARTLLEARRGVFIPNPHPTYA